MNILYEACAGLDGYKQSASVCVLRIEGRGKVVSVVRGFGTMTEELLFTWATGRRRKE
tara:strand:- start:1402 stop:1575 length:174 start_codon:yes stop_codon:yes gene_type:complete